MATLLAGIDADKVVADPAFADLYAQWLVEKFLIATDDGWILRKAQFYRGAIQEEDEREARAQPAHAPWPASRRGPATASSALRTGVRLLPHGADTRRRRRCATWRRRWPTAIRASRACA